MKTKIHSAGSTTRSELTVQTPCSITLPGLSGSPPYFVAKTPRSRAVLLRSVWLRRAVLILCCLVTAWTAIAQESAEEKKEKADHDTALVLAQKAIDSGEYDRAIELSTLVLRGWPGDSAATDILTRAQLRKKMKAPPRQPVTVQKTATPKAAPVEAKAVASSPKAAPAEVKAVAPPPKTTKSEAKPSVSPTKAAASGAKPVASPPKAASAEAKPVASPPPAQTQPSTQPPVEALSAPPPSLKAPKPTKHEISVSGDAFLGQGTVTLPFGYSLQQSLPGASVPVVAASFNRSSLYYGGTLSYSYGQSWYVDVSFAQGNSTGDQSTPVGWLGVLPSHFTIKDQWCQAYVRYTFPGLRGRRLSAYLRAGATYVTANLTDDATSPALGRYYQTDKTTDMLGNLGFGLGYSLYVSPGSRMRLGLQFEGEGFYGTRSQKSLETLSADEGVEFVTANINNSLYGGIARLTTRFEYRLGKSGLFRVFADGGAQGRYTLISYPGAGSHNEMLWGPYVKLGVRYAF